MHSDEYGGGTATGGGGNLDRPDLVRVFIDRLGRHPDALVAALNADGIIVPMPASVPLLNHRIAVGRSVLDMVLPADKPAVITTWERSRQTGGASLIAHLVNDPERPVLMTAVDASAEHGVHLVMTVPTSGANDRIGHAAALSVVAPRTARVVKNETAVITSIDAATTQILGWTPEQMVGCRSLDFIHPEDQERSISNWMEMLTAPGHEQRVRLRHKAADGSWVWMEIANRNLLDDPEHGCVLAEMLDVSDELAAQEALRASERRLRRLAEALPLGVVQIEAERRISYANERLASITGTPLTGQIDEQFQHMINADRAAFDAALDAVLNGGDDQDLHISFAAGELRHCTMSMRSLTNDSGTVTGAIVCVSDVSDQVRMTAELEHRATFDSLTGCFNRSSVMSQLETMLRDPSSGVAIVFVDLDGFKDVNDQLGHAAGDAVLAGIGAMLRDAVRSADIVGRVGGDEFLVVCPDIADIDEALSVAARIDATFARGIPIGDETLVVSASLGVAHTTDPSTSSDRLVADADTRMYAEKRRRKQQAPQSGQRRSVVRRGAADESLALEQAITNGQLEVHYQPIVSLPSGGVFGVEALIRWRRACTIVPAVTFIGLAERTGLITQIGHFVLDEVVRTAVETAADWRSVGTHWFVNMSPQELADPTKAAEVAATLERHHVDASRLVIEITEHGDLTKSSTALRTVNELAEMGAAIALDDFGTGHSSLALLRRVPVSYLKFDRSFTADLGVDPVAEHLLETCRDLASRLGIALVAEGVETEDQRARLIALGIHTAQGYLFSKPCPIADLRAGAEATARV